MRHLTFTILLGFLLFSLAMPSCKKEEITMVEYKVPIWKGSLDSAPPNPEVGWAYYDTQKMQSFIFDGSSWQVMAQDGKNGVNGNDGKDGLNGLGIIWKGELSTAPANPNINWAYYNTIDGIAYIFNGLEWYYLSKNGTDGINGQDGLGIVWKGELSTSPTDPKKNWAYYNTTDGIAYIFNGTNWNYLAKNGNDGEPGQNGLGIVWKGELSTAPIDPKTNWAYYNSTDGISYIFDGSEWNYLAKDGNDSENVNNDPTNFTSLDWDIKWDYISDEFYPSFTYMHLLSSYFRELPECITIKVPKDAVGAKITLTIDANQFMDKTVLEETVTTDKVEDKDWNWAPIINWKQDALLNADQPGFFNLNIVLEANNKVVKRITKRIIYHSINDCVFGFLDKNNNVVNTKWLFCSYVNEDNPKIDEILLECLERDNTRQFVGNQRTKQDVINQMYWIWEYFAIRNTRYSSITNTSSSDPKAGSQYVRLFDQCINNNQANCVDGSCLLASIYKKIDLDVGLVLIPRHCFLAVRPHTSDVSGQEDANVIFLETTLMGSASNPYNENDRMDSFNNAVQKGLNEVSELVNNGNSDKILMFFIDDMRKQFGIKPIPYSR